MNKMYLVLGDWSDDGHGKYEKVLLQSNLPVKIIQEAYKDACALTGIAFDDDDSRFENEKMSWQENEKRRIAIDYEENIVPKYCLEALESKGIKIEDWYTDDLSDKYSKDKEGNLIIGTEDFVNLWIAFVKLCLPQDAILQRAPQEEEIPVINGYWNKNLNTQFGYGLFH